MTSFTTLGGGEKALCKHPTPRNKARQILHRILHFYFLLIKSLQEIPALVGNPTTSWLMGRDVSLTIHPPLTFLSTQQRIPYPWAPYDDCVITNIPLTWHSNNLRHPPRLTTGAINNGHLSLYCITSSKANARPGNRTQAS